MREKSSNQKSSQQGKATPTAGPKGMAIAPPVSAPAIQRKADPSSAGGDSSGSSSPNRTGLPDALKSSIKSLSGLAKNNVRVHYNSSKPAQLQALAYAQGTDIHLGPGQERHLPHEAWHVVQQKQGDVIQRYPYLDGSTRYDSLIYGIYKLSGGVAKGSPSYIGQTTWNRRGDRWQEHVRTDAYAPWYYTNWATSPDVTDVKDAPYWWIQEEAPKNVTKVEITAAEQWWYEHYAKKGAKLLNPQTPMLKATFLKYTDSITYPGNYDPANVQIKKTWKPAQ